ncbi:mitochondrial genome maintenance MGM101-domain-containing protein [Microdochium trichocladiopsis]|uniref:Mitochondrial genome maintenance protein MGM101 n=1 Tax=Microdochium trichocladiopsis TaxID=1682393 RepID=A0A9P8YII3_9PEZI|nr:mitochondrial genome maintenance MGM101-domain-containing protein [Microdochium trichocladiopsis]KAH7040910.1 mitochondrial genome maintenance MGM101-domain-containing protein [Microdochium trichocladiopsis]
MQPLRAAAARSATRAQLRHATTATKPRAYPVASTAASKTTATPSSAAKTTAAASKAATPAATAGKLARTPLAQTTGQHIPDAPGFGTPSTLTGAPPLAHLEGTNGSSTAEAGAIDAAQQQNGGDAIDWSSSYHGLGTNAFPVETSRILMAPIDPEDVEVKPDGIIYLPEIKYRRILNNAFGPGAWGLAPRGQLMVQERLVTREYALVVHGRFVAQARGEQQYFSDDGVSTAAEGCKSNALMRCCKDLGIASELWDPRFIRAFMKSHAQQVWVEHATTKKKRQIWLRKDDEVRYPYKKSVGGAAAFA